MRIGVGLLIACCSGCADGDSNRNNDAADSGCPHDDSDFDAAAPTTSFELDVVPILQGSCAIATCHKAGTNAGGLGLGPPRADGPPSAAERAAIHAALLELSNAAPTLPHVTPGDPSRSFLMIKLDGCQSDLGLDCELRKCGDPMPRNAAQLPLETRDVVRRWIVQGAPDG